MTAAAETVVEKPEVEQDDVTAVQPDTEKVVEEVAELKAPAPVTNKDKAENRPVRTSNELTDDAALWTPVIDQLKAFGDTTVSATDTSWLFIFFAGFLGGLIALLTPCVWPMIPMTVSFFLKRTKDRKKAIRDAMTYGLSIIVIYLVMGLLITGIFGASALNDLSTNAIFNIIFFLLLVSSPSLSSGHSKWYYPLPGRINWTRRRIRRRALSVFSSCRSRWCWFPSLAQVRLSGLCWYRLLRWERR